MGYSHYYGRRRNVPAPADAYGRWAMDAKALIAAAEASGIRLAGWDGGREAERPEITEGYVSLNGWGDESCETFRWDAEVPANPEWVDADDDYSWFVKTRLRPYDAVVVALLLRLKHYYGDHVVISSDGSWDEYPYDYTYTDYRGQQQREVGVEPGWTLGRALYREVFGEDAPCPWSEYLTA